MIVSSCMDTTRSVGLEATTKDVKDHHMFELTVHAHRKPDNVAFFFFSFETDSVSRWCLVASNKSP
jgi:hypothetical protein